MAHRRVRVSILSALWDLRGGDCREISINEPMTEHMTVLPHHTSVMQKAEELSSEPLILGGAWCNAAAMSSNRAETAKRALSIWATLTRAFCVVAVLAALTSAPEAEAQAVNRVSASAKGMIGLGLLGAELGLIAPAFVPAREWWPYVVFPVVGAAGGIVGGYFLEEATQNTPEIAIAFMVAGFVLAVPAVVGTLALTADSPGGDSSSDGDEARDAPPPPPEQDSVEAVEDGGSDTEPAPADETEEPVGEDEAETDAEPSAPSARMPAMGGLLVVGPGGARIGIPMLAAVPRFTGEEIARLRLQQETDLGVTLVRGQF